MPVMSAGLLVYRVVPGARAEFEVLIAHMGGPFWAGKSEGAWTIPKGEFDPDEESALDAARREFVEELGVDPPAGDYAPLGTFAYSSGKRIVVFVVVGADFAPVEFTYGTFDLEWPSGSGTRAGFPEVDQARWVPEREARDLLVKGQRPALEALAARLAEAADTA
ncbi:MAG TPA: DNA mismatch repair protein MutT [Microbacterium sp.]|nr:DNA mismatch repair protein MutT [Microbacterium sp.]